MKKVVHRHIRPFQNRSRTVPSPSPNILLQQVNDWITNDRDLYLGFGGMGDALLTLAACWNNPKAKCIFFANVSSIPFIESIFKLFYIPCLIRPNIMGTIQANQVHDKMIQTGRLKTSAHLADGLNYEDWRNEEKYRNRIVKNVPWVDKIGKISSSRKIITIAPHGSQHEEGRQRYLSPDEFSKICNKYVNKGFDVYGIGSDDQRKQFPLKENCFWATNQALHNYAGNKKNIDLAFMLRIINASSEVISVDTWLKTYSLLIGIPGRREPPAFATSRLRGQRHWRFHWRPSVPFRLAIACLRRS